MNRTRARRALSLVAAVTLGLVAGGWMREQLRIDGCLDGGGRWDQGSGQCRYADAR